MKKLLWLLAAPCVILLATAPAGAQSSQSLAGARAAAAALGGVDVGEPEAAPAVPKAVDMLPTGSPAQVSDPKTLPPVDPKTAEWLASRIPGLDVKNLVAPPFDVVDELVARLAGEKKDYLDLLSDPIVTASQPPLYFLSREVLTKLDAKYKAGTLPVTGTTTDGQPIKMEGVVAGMGATHYLYDQTKEFGFKAGSYEFKIADGHVVNKIEGPADITIQGLQGCGHILFFSGCADIQRITKVAPGKVKVITTRGPQDSEIFPITPK
ncbi:MAG: hypothetical protein NTX64_13230 [Elusimicrobia bacterium]|nr:hypothetical protein [Elusimicrobiota bacterium]